MMDFRPDERMVSNSRPALFGQGVVRRAEGCAGSAYAEPNMPQIPNPATAPCAGMAAMQLVSTRRAKGFV